MKQIKAFIFNLFHIKWYLANYLQDTILYEIDAIQLQFLPLSTIFPFHPLIHL